MLCHCWLGNVCCIVFTRVLVVVRVLVIVTLPTKRKKMILRFFCFCFFSCPINHVLRAVETWVRKADPVRTLLVLRAWVIWRAKENNFSSASACRRSLFAKELATLRKDVEAMSSAAQPTLGNRSADARICSFVPDILTPRAGV